MINELTIMTSARRMFSLGFFGLRNQPGSRPGSIGTTPRQHELDGVLNACDDEPAAVRRCVERLKSTAWWV